jgi:hypothetical protein
VADEPPYGGKKMLKNGPKKRLESAEFARKNAVNE